VTLAAVCDGNPTSYLWSNGSTAQSIVVTPFADTTYTVKAANSGGSSAEAAATVQLNVPAPTGPPSCTIGSTVAAAVEPGTQVTLSATCTNYPTAYTWSILGTFNGKPTSVDVGFLPTVIVFPTQATRYALTAKNALGTTTVTKDVAVDLPAPTCSITQDP
jgi:hypothetical protein